MVVFGLAGTAYTLLMAGSGPETAKPSPKPSNVAYSLPKPPKPAPNAPVGVSISSLLSPVKAGSNTSVSIKTTPGAACSISVVYAGRASDDSGLAPKKADDYGLAIWTWTVGAAVPVGTWPVKVTCVHHGKSGVVQDDLRVAPQK